MDVDRWMGGSMWIDGCEGWMGMNGLMDGCGWTWVDVWICRWMVLDE